ncbi:FadR/GntR family transcriptional regulator [Nocardioides marmotae]|uniref:GntR family transcriptional regulator n=1 Tax=Nocardioides marmotae TaxID=2663857 RepID=A0A6I3JAF1_9ACTN|nr:GntR family transcriptional regulator [Nocardioides marmotae]MCR6030569.1 GntR family transcriptional regulator [Gordonia jinghuaiqii]MBC9734953.1 GntR family transcriptional regulator [Nocardioides marmotae]MTB86052.1 GntR family transcriptional regulator [Nocardioides marmotae]MTB94205.1 GntR family transcriptional regulator [Nocardioides marmotae]QKE00492.1 GntR family transcriptional regulator [Nocardioides marmotae]
MSEEPPPRRLTPLRRERLYESLAAHISDFIEAQGLVGGDRLPPERQLAAELGVSRATLSRALASLETRGRIEVRHGVGALVREPEPPGGAAWQAGLAERPRSEVQVAREAVLAGLARVAAGADSSLRTAMLAPDGRPRTFDHTWRCVRRLAGGGLLAELDDALAGHAPGPGDTPEARERLDALADAVLRGDAAAAATTCQGMLGG